MTGAWLVGGIATGWATFTTVMLLWPGLGASDPDASLPSGFAHQRLQFELSQIIPLFAIVALGVLFYVLGKPTRAQLARDVGVDVVPEPAGEARPLVRAGTGY
jgi:hypothetical protein